MDTKKLNMFMNILKFGLVAVGVIAAFLVIGGPNMEVEESTRVEFRDGARMGMAINYTLLIIIASVIFVLFFFVLQLITNTKKTVMSIIGLIAALVVYLIFLMAGTSDTNESLQLQETQYVADSTLGSTTAGLYTVLIGVVVGLLVWILSPLMGRYRK